MSITPAHAFVSSDNGNGTFNNPLMWADVPDLSVIRVGNAYYMTSTTMHMAPGIPVMRSYDLVNWEIINYCYSQLEKSDAFALKNGKNDYANGSWASNIRYDKYQKRFYVIVACNTTNKSYVFSAGDIENGPWHRSVVDKVYDPGLLFDDTGTGYKRWVFYGQQKEHYREVLVDPKTFDVTLGPEKLWKETCDHENKAGVWVEGAQSIKVGDYIDLFMIALRDKRTQIVWRGKDVNDPDSWEVRRVFYGNMRDKDGKEYMPSSGIAQGAIVDTADGKWYALLFQDNGSVGRIPVLLPMKWTADGWPVIGNDGTSVDNVVPMPATPAKQKTNIVASDEFDNGGKRRFISEEEVGTGIIAGLTAQQINAIVKRTAAAGNLITNGNFENNSTTSWSINGGDGLAKLSVEQDAQGNRFAKLTERKNTIAGPSQNLSGKLVPGATYRVTARVRYDDYTDAAGQKITTVPERDFKITTLFGGQFGDAGIQRVQKGQWTTLTGSFTVPVDAKVADAALFFETTWAPVGDLSDAENKSKHNFDFAIDDITLTRDEIADAIAKNEYGYNGSNLKLQWQWNHNPNNNLWSLTERKGFLRLKSGLLAHNIRDARNTLTQRTFGPVSSSSTMIDVSQMKNGDVAGISAFQNQYGFVGVKMVDGQKQIVMQRAQKKDDANGKVIESIPLTQNQVYLKVDCDFYNRADRAYFYYSLDGKTWKRLGDTLQMFYDWPDFVGYRFGLFYYSTAEVGGYVDFDYFRVSDKITAP